MGNNITKIKQGNKNDVVNNNKDYPQKFENLNDEYNDRLIYQHFILKNILNGNLHFKKEDINNIIEENNFTKSRTNILDIGCGTGVWCFDLMEEIKDGIDDNIYIYGTDIKKRYPYEIKPKNIEFGIMSTLDNIENSNLNFIKKDNFDLIYQRLMFLTFKNNEWEIAINNIYKLLKKEGLVEIVDTNFIINYDINPSKNIENMNERWILYLKSCNININMISKLDNILLKNYIKVEKKEIKIQIGDINNNISKQFVDNWSLIMLNYIDKIKYEDETEDEFKNIVKKCKMDLLKSNSYYIYFYIYIGKKLF